MAQVRLSMRAIREVLRLKYERGLSGSAIEASCGIARSTANDYILRARQAGFTWPLPDGVSDFELDRRLFPSGQSPAPAKAMPDFAHIQSELRKHKRFNLTKDQLWQEYREQHPDGYSYSQFCLRYKDWLKKQDRCMRQEHRYGEKLFVDYGDGLYVTDEQTGARKLTQLFVSAWGASHFIYAEASLTQKSEAWIWSHVRAFDYFDCVPEIVVPDNLKSGVKDPCFYEPDINSKYLDMAQYYGCAIIPARPLHPKDKAKVEVGVLIAKRWILSVLRNRIFHTLAEMNVAIRELLEKANNRKLRKLGVSRRELFEKFDRPAALKKPERAYEPADWRTATLNIDYHVVLEEHYYSAPHKFVHEKLDIRVTEFIVEIFFKGERVAAHQRSYVKHGYTTLKEHMPETHQKYLEWPPSRIIAWGQKTGPNMADLMGKIMAGRLHPEQGYRSCFGILRLGRHYSAERMESAAKRAVDYRAYSFRAVRNILEKGLDKSVKSAAIQPSFGAHENIRGGQYYIGKEEGHA